MLRVGLSQASNWTGVRVAFAVPGYTRPEVRRAGEWLIDPHCPKDKKEVGTAVLTNWRAAHGYPLNTFQATLRNKLKRIDPSAIVGERLKRAPSVIAKLQRFDSMKLHQMQDIAGLRGIVASMPKLRRLHEDYEQSRFSHQLVKTYDYVANPKPDGYRSIHLVYRYRNPLAPEYDNLNVELQLRTQLQHAWATAVETVDAYLGQAIKAGRPGEKWAEFFKLAGAAFARIEKSPMPDGLDDAPPRALWGWLRKVERDLGVLVKLQGFRVATDQIIKSGRSKASYHLVVLDTANRVLRIRSFSLSEQESANDAYAEQEQRAAAGAPIDAVLVTGGTVDTLRKSYPNYFLDTDVFVRRLEKVFRDGY